MIFISYLEFKMAKGQYKLYLEPESKIEVPHKRMQRLHLDVSNFLRNVCVHALSVQLYEPNLFPLLRQAVCKTLLKYRYIFFTFSDRAFNK